MGEGKRPCRAARRTFGYAKVRRCSIAKGRVRIPTPLASTNLSVCARAGRQAEFLGPPWRPPDSGRGDRYAARAPGGVAEGRKGPNMTERLTD